jgi:hypothetical protein
MPLEIRELLIRTLITTGPEGGTELPERSANMDHERRQIVDDCVKQVMKKLRKYKER